MPGAGDSVETQTHDTLQEFLDGELDAASAAAMRRSAESDPALAEALAELEGDRGWRQQAWRSLEPDDAYAARLASQVILQVHRGERRRRLMAWMRGPAAAAACLAIFATGWIARDRAGVATPEGFTPIPSKLSDSWSFDNRGTPTRGMVNVALTDETGNVIAVQRFNEIGEAKRFADDLTRWQAQRQQVQQGRLQRVGEQF